MIRGGRSYVSSPPAFSNDSKRLLVCTSNTVSIFSTSTGVQITSLEGHTAPVTAVIVVPALTPASKILCYCWTASLDGRIKYWDFSAPELLKTIDVKLPIFSMVIPCLLGQPAQSDEKPPKLFAYLSVEDTRETTKSHKKESKPKPMHGRIYKSNLSESRLAGGVTLAEMKEPQAISISSSGKYFGIRKQYKLLIWKVPDIESERVGMWKITLFHTKKMTVLAFHPTQRIVAAGDVTGRILIWRGFGDRKFATSGKLVNGNTNNEEGRPGVRDNDDADLCTTWHWHPSECKSLPCPLPKEYKGLCSDIAFDHCAGSVALRTENYCIQFYSQLDDRGISEVQVCERNHQPRDDVTVVVTLVSLSQDGSMMSTVEAKLAEEGIGSLVCLKFWASGPQNKEFTLSTIVYEPHRDAGISAVAFHPNRHLMVGTSRFGVAMMNCSRKILRVLAGVAMLLAHIKYLVATAWGAKPQLSVWNMSTLSTSWSYMLHVEALACAIDTSAFAALALLPESSNCKESNGTTFQGRDGVVLLFNASDPVPVGSWSVRKAKGGALAFLQANPSFTYENISGGKAPQQLLAYINGNHEYVLFDPYGKQIHELSLILLQDDRVAHEEKAQFGYASIYGELPEFELKTNQEIWVASVPSEKPWESIFSGSSHNLPPLTKLCSAFLESLLERRTSLVE